MRYFVAKSCKMYNQLRLYLFVLLWLESKEKVTQLYPHHHRMSYYLHAMSLKHFAFIYILLWLYFKQLEALFVLNRAASISFVYINIHTYIFSLLFFLHHSTMGFVYMRRRAVCRCRIVFILPTTLTNKVSQEKRIQI